MPANKIKGAYQLTLTLDERKAIDWIGNRYRHGDELYRLLTLDSEQEPIDPANPDGEYVAWSGDSRDITFNIPEHVAWSIADIINEDNGSLACFADELVSKLWDFASKVI